MGKSLDGQETSRWVPAPRSEFDLDAADSRIFITGWKMASGQPGFVQPDEEGGYKLGCAAYDFDDSGWYTRTSPMSYGTPESPDLSDYYWARTRVFLPKDVKEKDLSLVLGGFGLFEYRYMRVFVNGHEVGTRRYSTRWTSRACSIWAPSRRLIHFCDSARTTSSPCNWPATSAARRN